MTTLQAQVLNELQQYQMSGQDIIDYYQDNLERLVNDAIAKVETFINTHFKTSQDLWQYWNDAGNHLSLELIKQWCEDPTEYDGMTTMEALEDMLDDNLANLIAQGMLGNGRGLWELFDQDFPCLNTLV